jgi:hypothetical protein
MACCALAAFLISQIIFALDWARERLGLRQAAAPLENPVVAWRLGDGGAAAEIAGPGGRGRSRARLALAAAAGIASFVVLAALTLRAEAGAHAWNTITLICTGHGLERLVLPPGR